MFLIRQAVHGSGVLVWVDFGFDFLGLVLVVTIL